MLSVTGRIAVDGGLQVLHVALDDLGRRRLVGSVIVSLRIVSRRPEVARSLGFFFAGLRVGHTEAEAPRAKSRLFPAPSHRTGPR